MFLWSLESIEPTTFPHSAAFCSRLVCTVYHTLVHYVMPCLQDGTKRLNFAIVGPPDLDTVNKLLYATYHPYEPLTRWTEWPSDETIWVVFCFTISYIWFMVFMFKLLFPLRHSIKFIICSLVLDHASWKGLNLKNKWSLFWFCSFFITNFSGTVGNVEIPCLYWKSVTHIMK